MTEIDDDDLVSPETRAKIKEFEKKWPWAWGGPAHIVLDDFNLDDGYIEWCIELINGVLTRQGTDETLAYLEKLEWYAEHSVEELTDTKAFLQQLLEIPEDKR
jgi:hypothetical protein